VFPSGALWGLGYFYTVTAGLAVRIGGSGANIDVAVMSAGIGHTTFVGAGHDTVVGSSSHRTIVAQSNVSRGLLFSFVGGGRVVVAVGGI
jgi:hypothetical protein